MKKLKTNIMAGMVAAASVATLSGCALVDVVQDALDSMRPVAVYGPPPIEDEYDQQMIEAVYGPPPEFYEENHGIGIGSSDDLDGTVRPGLDLTSSQADGPYASDSAASDDPSSSDEPAAHKGLGLFPVYVPEEEIPEAVYGPPEWFEEGFGGDPVDPVTGAYSYDPAEEEPVDVYGPPSDFGISEEEDQG